jgi:hypothetical protein
MDNFSTFRDLIDVWPTRSGFASDVGVPVGRVHKWVQNNSIPAPLLNRVLAACSKRKIGITADALIKMAAEEGGE